MNIEITWPLVLFVAAFGLCIGSFLNVCIYRIPAGKSVVRPGSQCPKCQYKLRWYDNIPVFSWLILGAKCRSCRAPISWRYPGIELLTGALGVAGLFWFHQVGWWLLIYITFVVPLIVVTFIDYDHQIIPDVISLPGIVVGLLVRGLTAEEGMLWAELIDSSLGILVGGGLLYAVGMIYFKLRGQEGLGGGDVKLGAMMGAFLGWQAGIWILFMSSFLGSLVGLVIMAIRGKNMQYMMPFGPFMVISALIYLFFADYLMNFLYWYQGLFS